MISEEYRWYPVRCCCKPIKIMGFMRLSVDGGTSRVITDRAGQKHNIEIKTIAMPAAFDYQRISRRREPVRFDRETEIAIYSDDRPLEFWLGFRDFIENPHAR